MSEASASGRDEGDNGFWNEGRYVAAGLIGLIASVPMQYVVTDWVAILPALLVGLVAVRAGVPALTRAGLYHP
jgi:hypothetical protein